MQEEPYEQEIEAARAVTEDVDASDEAQRSARARIRRMRQRDPALGVGAFDFDVLPGPALRIYCTRQWRVDPTGDERLIALLSDPFAQPDVEELARLMNRPHYTLKLNTHPNAYRPDAATAFHMVRSSKLSAKRGRDAEPFEPNDALVLFDDLTRRPVHRGTVAGVAQTRTYDAASGTIAINISPVY